MRRPVLAFCLLVAPLAAALVLAQTPETEEEAPFVEVVDVDVIEVE